jgi:NAD(P)H-dependent FMN reductase
MRPLNIPVLLGTSRKGRLSAHAARFIVDLLNRRAGVTSALVDVSQLPLPTDDAGQAIKDARFSATMAAADALVIVAPEYNHSFPGLLKHALDSCLTEYIHKPVGLVGVSSGPFAGIRVVQSLLPVMRELGLVTIFWDINFGTIGKVFDESGRLLDEAFVRRSDKFVRELIWMAKVLRHGREQVTIDEEAAEIAASALKCSVCGAMMNHHGDKLMMADTPEDAPSPIASMHACPACGHQTAVIGAASATSQLGEPA